MGEIFYVLSVDVPRPSVQIPGTFVPRPSRAALMVRGEAMREGMSAELTRRLECTPGPT